MKKNILALLLLATFFVHAEDAPKINRYRNYYIMVNDIPTDVPSIVDYREMNEECIGKQNIELFKALKARLAKRGFNIFKVRIWGKSFLQNAIGQHYETTLSGFNNFNTTQERSDAFIDYLLSQITKEDLNEFIDTACQPGVCWFGPAVAFAAYYSPSCFKKIIAHRYFDATTFLQSKMHPKWDNTPSLNLQRCKKFLEWRMKKNYIDQEVGEKLLVALEEFKALQPAK